MQSNDPKAETTEFKGRRILVTGGTKGIGPAIVDRLIRGGGNLIAAARTVSPGTLADRFVQADLSAREGIESVVKAVTDRLQWSGHPYSQPGWFGGPRRWGISSF